MVYPRAALEDRVYRQLYDLEDRHWWFRGRRAVIWAMLDRADLPPRPRLLDAGCGTGRNLVEYGRLARATGVDPSAQAIAFCRERGLRDVSVAGLEALPFASGSFDLLMACDVLEHVDDDGAALAELRRVAAPDGRLLLTVPAYSWLWSQHDDTHHHRRRYTLRRLRDRVAAAGWRPALTTYFNSTLLPPIAVVRLLARRGRPANGRSDYELVPGPLNAGLELLLRGEARVIARGGSLPAGVSVGMVCTRR